MDNMDSIRKKVADAYWYHSFEVLPGVVTPGSSGILTDPRKIFNERYALAPDLSGMTALDIGALDGPYSFELERRGAIVTALDIQNPDHTGFNTAKSIRNSKVQYIQGSVYDLSTLLKEKYDIITYFGVWYHLKNPVSAFQQLSDVLKDSGLLLLEGECLLNYAEDPGTGKPTDSSLVRAMAKSSLPVSLFYAGTYKASLWNWHLPNVACVKEWLATAGLDLFTYGLWNHHPNQRLYGTAKKAKSSQATVDNPVW